MFSGNIIIMYVESLFYSILQVHLEERVPVKKAECAGQLSWDRSIQEM